MALSLGAKLGPFEVIAAIGAGGMGEVYRARDTRRTVAIKILPAQFTSDPVSKQRFEREAKVISSLNHPHICVLYDIGHQDGIDYIVMECVEGETLAKRPSRRLEICDAIVNILHNKPYVMPKLSIAMRIVPTIKSRGVDAGIEEYERLKVTHPGTFNFSDESELNSLGYQLLSEGQVQAVQLFELNTREFPAFSNAYDSLGEAYSKAGKKDRAIEAYTKAIELDPNNWNSRKMLRRLE
jgi:tetratricopeptide (TPR) repeat protein